MTTNDLIKEVEQIVKEELLPLMQAKNNDYADPMDAFSNFKEFGMIGLLVRMNDKMNRLRNLRKKQFFGVNPSIKGESFEDTLIDLINYALIALVYYRLERK